MRLFIVLLALASLAPRVNSSARVPEVALPARHQEDEGELFVLWGPFQGMVVYEGVNEGPGALCHAIFENVGADFIIVERRITVTDGVTSLSTVKKSAMLPGDTFSLDTLAPPGMTIEVEVRATGFRPPAFKAMGLLKVTPCEDED